MLKMWLLKIFCRKEVLLENILMELRNIHYHLDRLESFYMVVNNIKEDEEKITIGDIIIRKERGENNGLPK
ncbi:hypothetical protein ES705_49068 [subsurface metagenome]